MTSAARAPRCVRALGLAAALLGAGPAFGQVSLTLTPSRLTYTLAPSARGCPKEEAFRVIVAQHLSQKGPWPDPFTGGPDSQRIGVEVGPEAGGYKVLLSLFDGDGKLLDRFDPWRAATCKAAVDDVGQAVVQWLVTIAAPPAEAPAAVPLPAPAAPAPKPPEPPSRSEIPPDDLPPVLPPQPPPAPKLPIKWRVGAMLRVDVTPQTAAAFGVSGDVEAAGPGFSVAVQVHGVPAARSTSGGFDASLVAGGLLACWRLDARVKTLPLVVPICAIGEVGAIQPQQSGGAYHLGHVGFLAGGGLHLSIEIPLGTTGFHVSPAVDGLYVVQSVLISGAGPWTPVLPVPPSTVSGGAFGAGLGAGYSF